MTIHFSDALLKQYQQLSQKDKSKLHEMAVALNHKDFKALKKTIKNPFAEARLNSIHVLWFNQYQDALHFLNAKGGYLLPCEKRYFIANAEAIKSLGMDPDDDDWQNIDYNWIFPKDPEALFRLFEKQAQQYS